MSAWIFSCVSNQPVGFTSGIAKKENRLGLWCHSGVRVDMSTGGFCQMARQHSYARTHGSVSDKSSASTLSVIVPLTLICVALVLEAAAVPDSVAAHYRSERVRCAGVGEAVSSQPLLPSSNTPSDLIYK